MTDEFGDLFYFVASMFSFDEIILKLHLLINVYATRSIIDPTPLEGGGTIYSNGFFLFRQF